MVLAQRMERNRALDDLAPKRVGASAVLGRKRRVQLWIPVVAGRRVVQRAQEPLRGLFGARSVEIHSQGTEDLADVAPEAAPVLRRDPPRVNGRPLSAQLDDVLRL